MGDPKRPRKKYSTPKHPWQRARIEAERELVDAYGLHNKKEIWKMASVLRKFSRQAKKLAAVKSSQAEIERAHLLKKAQNLGLLKEGSKVDDILTLSIHDVMNRRLQSLVCRKNLARSMPQARQFIVHEHITVADRKINSPSYIVPVAEEPLIGFDSSSTLFSAEHPERIILEPKAKKKRKVIRKENKGRRKNG
ncbi:MAG TPA: 30S ribosomal protein S4 [Candidatus Nanoarchaeia archaeon]|nr:30S ribosomal protein S4 [Candidatus Nanoarchaeia archaeon]